MLRLVNRGHHEEQRFLQWLRGIGFDVKQTEIDGKQIRFAAVDGHFGGSCDGNAFLPTRYGNFPQKILLEFKTSNHKLFGPIKNSGVIKEKPVHFSQMCTYGVALGIQYALYICINKNDDDLDIELIELDYALGESEIKKANDIIRSEYPPLRVLGHGLANYKCKYCCLNDVCHMGAPMNKNCRSCAAAVPAANGEWFCRQWNNTIPKDFIPKGCEAYTELPR
jgi:hypothetical protein